MLFTAFTLGLFGSLHCIGMCGPIALALPKENNRWSAAWKILLYNLGRTTTYILLGVLVGLVGEGLLLIGLQKWVSIGTGVFLLAVAIFSIPVERQLVQSKYIGQFYLWMKRNLGKLLAQKSSFSFYKTGLLNGFLPCGLVYMAIVGAFTMGHLWSSIRYMCYFGLGTIPLMMVTAFAGQLVSLSLRNRLKKMYPAFLVSLALLFIFRGMQFDVPADFSFWEMMRNVPMCH